MPAGFEAFVALNSLRNTADPHDRTDPFMYFISQASRPTISGGNEIIATFLGAFIDLCNKTVKIRQPTMYILNEGCIGFFEDSGGGGASADQDAFIALP